MLCEKFFDQSGIGEEVRSQLVAEYPQELLEDQEKLSALVIELVNCFKDSINIKIIDPQSPQGILKSLRYRVRKYPTFIIEGKELIVGWEREALDHALEACFSNINSV